MSAENPRSGWAGGLSETASTAAPSVANLRTIPGAVALCDSRQTASQLLAATDVDGLLHRVLQDALTEVSANQWDRRAAMYEWAAPRPEDYRGAADLAELDAQARRCDLGAARCRIHAHILRGGDLLDPDIARDVRLVAGQAGGRHV